MLPQFSNEIKDEIKMQAEWASLIFIYISLIFSFVNQHMNRFQMWKKGRRKVQIL